ncbi:MAG: hypothetical protein NVS2B15_13960 [Pseudarthrobacter sp.]
MLDFVGAGSRGGKRKDLGLLRSIPAPIQHQDAAVTFTCSGEPEPAGGAPGQNPDRQSLITV